MAIVILMITVIVSTVSHSFSVSVNVLPLGKQAVLVVKYYY